MGSGEKVSFSELTGAQAAQLLRELANGLEGLPAEGEPRFSLDSAALSKCKISLKKESSGYELKIKVKHLDMADPPEDADKPEKTEPVEDDEPSDYKKIKKQMGKQFKRIIENLLIGVLPDDDVVHSFLNDSRRMTAFPQYGQEYYPVFETACDQFREAFEKRDPEACKNAYQALSRIKKECHERYK